MNNFNRTVTRTFTTGIAATVLGVGVLAASGQAMADDRYAVAYTPEQIQSTAGMQALQAKIRSAASEACPSYSESRSFQVVNLCRSEVSRDLVAKINVPEFTAFVEQSDQSATADFVASVSTR